MNYQDAKAIYDKIDLAYDVGTLNSECLNIRFLLNQTNFDINAAREKICSINEKYPDNILVYNLLFPPCEPQISIGEANEPLLRLDLQWKHLYLVAKSQAKLFDEFLKEVDDIFKNKESADK